MKPLVGISCCTKQFGVFGMPNHAASDTYIRATDNVVGAVPILMPANGPTADIETLLDRLDGIILTGSRSNVQPTLYDGPPHAEGTPEDPARDGITLPLIRAAVLRGVPVLAICRGFQEVNVALGGTLYPEIRDLPGRMNHRMPPNGSLEEKFALRHPVRFTEGGPFQRLFGAAEVMTNTLHGQGIKCAGRGIVIDGHAPDGTPEAIYVKDAPGFTLSVQWHPEFNAANDPVSRPLFQAFGAAARDYAARRHAGPALKRA